MLTEPQRTARSAGSRALPLAALTGLTGLTALTALAVAVPAWARWPWQHRPAAASTQTVSVLAVTLGSTGASNTPAAGKAPIAQYWDRNTLLLDLTHLSAAGSATLTPVPANGGWPVRLEFRVQPGAHRAPAGGGCAARDLHRAGARSGRGAQARPGRLPRRYGTDHSSMERGWRLATLTGAASGCVEIDRRECAAPDAAGVEPEHVPGHDRSPAPTSARTRCGRRGWRARRHEPW